MGLLSQVSARVRRFLRAVLLFSGRAALWSSQHVYRTPYEIEMYKRIKRQAAWDADRGDQTLRLDYDLGPDAVVYDVGGYEGNFAADVLCLFGCHIEVFEPIPDFFDIIRQRFRLNPNVRAHQFGLSGADADVLMTMERGASSAVIVAEVPPTEPVRLRDIAAVLAELGHASVDLMKINIEGGEYDLLDRMIECDLTGRVRHLQIQFHLHVPEAQARMERISAALERTHELRWRYPWVWESWTLREPVSAD
ncbi:MAG: hypothetical protein QOG49_1225 [Frankiaceae bacterium]|nr:hypothetical protein [Frankiaceae bacterium]